MLARSYLDTQGKMLVREWTSDSVLTPSSSCMEDDLLQTSDQPGNFVATFHSGTPTTPPGSSPSDLPTPYMPEAVEPAGILAEFQ